MRLHLCQVRIEGDRSDTTSNETNNHLKSNLKISLKCLKLWAFAQRSRCLSGAGTAWQRALPQLEYKRAMSQVCRMSAQ